MSTKRTSLSANVTRTLLIILGVIIAALLTLNSSIFFSDASSAFSNKFLAQQEEDKKIKAETISKSTLEGLVKVSKFIYRNLPTFEK